MNKSSYEAVVLPNIKAYQVSVCSSRAVVLMALNARTRSQVKCTSLGAPSETLEVETEAIAKELEWGEVRGGRTDRWLGWAARRGTFSRRPTFCPRCW